MNIPKTSAHFSTSLASKITSSASSMELVSATDKAGNALSGLHGFTVDKGTASEEFILGTVSGTTVTITARGLDPADGKTERSALKFAHRRGATVDVTDFPLLANVGRLLNGDETLPNKLSYSSHPTFSSDTELVDKKYVDDVALAGAPDASTTVKGVAEEATQAEIDADTAAGGTSARLFINPSTLATSKYGTQLPSSTQKSALASTTTPGSGNKYITQSDFQKGTERYAVATGSANAYVVTLSPVPAALTAGMVVHFKANFTITGACTLNVNSLGAVAIKRSDGTDTILNDIVSGQTVTVVYDGTNWQLQTALGNPIVGVTASDNLKASANTERSTTGSSATKVKEIRVAFGGTIRVKFDMKCDDANTAHGQVYINGVVAGSDQTRNAASYATFSEDFTINPGDRVQLYYNKVGGGTVFVQNFRIYYDKTASTETVVNTD